MLYIYIKYIWCMIIDIDKSWITRKVGCSTWYLPTLYGSFPQQIRQEVPIGRHGFCNIIDRITHCRNTMVHDRVTYPTYPNHPPKKSTSQILHPCYPWIFRETYGFLGPLGSPWVPMGASASATRQASAFPLMESSRPDNWSGHLKGCGQGQIYAPAEWFAINKE